MSFSGVPLPGDDGGTNSSDTNGGFESHWSGPSYSSNDLWLSIDAVSNGISYLGIHPPKDQLTNVWNVFYTTNLSVPFTNWSWIFITAPGQTNLTIANATDAQGFYALGLVDTNGRPIAFGDNIQVCGNTPVNFQLGLDYPSYHYTTLTHPTNGILNGMPPYMTYTGTNCSGGSDSFIFKVNDGTNYSAPATVTLTIYPDQVYAYEVPVQTCRATPVAFTLSGADSCNQTLHYAVSAPAHGSITNVSGQDTDPNYVYTPTNASFTGMDSFSFVVFNDCGTAATNTVDITIGTADLFPVSQSLMTGTNEAISIVLSLTDPGICMDDTNYFVYHVTGTLTNGTLTGTTPNLTYTPTNGDGVDSFQFTVSDGVWSSSFAANVKIYTVAGPILTTECDPFGPAVQLEWALDPAVNTMWQTLGLNINDFIVYRSPNSGGPYTSIFTNYNVYEMSYLDTNTFAGQTNYYVVTFESVDGFSATTYESPESNQVVGKGQNPDDLIPPDAIWDVTDISHTNAPVHLGNKRAPFSSLFPNQYPNLYPWPNTNWPTGLDGAYSTWTNHTKLVIPTNAILAQVQYSIAIDNQYWLYLNGAFVGSADNDGVYAVWSTFQSFESVVPGRLHYGTNDIGVVIQDWGDINYFSLVVTTNTCGR